MWRGRLAAGAVVPRVAGRAVGPAPVGLQASAAVSLVNSVRPAPASRSAALVSVPGLALAPSPAAALPVSPRRLALALFSGPGPGRAQQARAMPWREE